MNLHRAVVFVAFAGVLATDAAAQPAVSLERAFPYLSFTQPVFLTHAGDGTNRVFVVEQDGLIRVFPNDQSATRASLSVFLDLTPVLSRFHNEAGLLGAAFHPDHAQNGYVYVYYTRAEPNRSVISRFSVYPEDANTVDPESEFVLLEILQPFLNHQAGMMQFGPADGYLYVSVGDGGDRLNGELYPPDSESNGQNRQTLLGTILRLDVDNPSENLNYGIPPDNPFVGNAAGWREEIWAYGLRNPWRFSLDGPSGRLWLADVGAKAWEEINLVDRGDNLGWSTMEGTDCFHDPECDESGLRLPIVQEPHVGSCNSITGGYVYRGTRRPELVGAYLYGDYCHGYIRLVRYEDQIEENDNLVDSNLRISSFGTDEDGELYVVNHNGTLAWFSQSNTGTEAPREQRLESTRLLPNFPNPFRPPTEVRYRLSEPGAIELTVYDLLGREVRRLAAGRRAAGIHSAEWDGTDDGGQRLGAGVYLVRLRHTGGIETRTMVLLQ